MAKEKNVSVDKVVDGGKYNYSDIFNVILTIYFVIRRKSKQLCG